MCGRYTLIKLADFVNYFPWIHPPDELPPDRFNIAPSQAIPVVPNDGSHKLQFFHWGLIPPWAKDPSVGNRMINARAETLSSKPVFRKALARRRCLIPASGFYEWKKSLDGKSKRPMYIRLRSHRPFAFAGLWETWRDEYGNEIPSCTIITTEPNELMKSIHDRMPAIIRPENYRPWLDVGEKPADAVMQLLELVPASEMETYPVSQLVNRPSNDSPDCIEAMTEESAAPVSKEGTETTLFD